MQLESYPSHALTEVEVAHRLGLSTQALRAWRSRGMGPKFCRFGRAVRYLSEDVDQYIAAHSVHPRDTKGSHHG